MLNFFWPTERNPDPSGLTRFGRVIHWIGFGFFILVGIGALLGAGLGAYQLAINETGYYGTPYGPTTLGLSVIAFVFALLVYLAARALRYIFSGE